MSSCSICPRRYGPSSATPLLKSWMLRPTSPAILAGLHPGVRESEKIALSRGNGRRNIAAVHKVVLLRRVLHRNNRSGSAKNRSRGQEVIKVHRPKNRRSVSRNPQQSRDYDDDYADFSGQNPQYKRARQDGQQSTQSRRARQRTRRRNQPQEPIVRQPRSSGGPSLNRSAPPQDFGPRQNPQPRMTGHRQDRHYEARSEGETEWF